MSDFPVVSDVPEVQDFYLQMRSQGTGHKLAEMLALQQPPRSNSDVEFLRGHCNGNQFEGQDSIGDVYRKRGGSNTKGKVYLHQLAKFPGDPRAWVSGRGDIKKVCEENGWGCDGLVKTKTRQQEPEDKPYRVADDLVDERVKKNVIKDPGLRKKKLPELREQARDQITPKIKY